jgi:uncharacterized membrane protein required for colicin V production
VHINSTVAAIYIASACHPSYAAIAAAGFVDSKTDATTDFATTADFAATTDVGLASS